MPNKHGEVTAQLHARQAGEADADSRLYTLVYGKLKQLARGYLRMERSDHTLQTTDLVHEAYLRMSEAGTDCQDRAHFFRLAAQAMRRILVDHARKHRAGKRGGGALRVTLDESLSDLVAQPEKLIEIDEALQRLVRYDARAGCIVEMRFFAGLTDDETAQALNISARTVKRDWKYAKAWLSRELSGNPK